MNENLKGKGNCKIHGPYIWKYVNGVCITEHISKEQTKFPTSPCTKKRPDLDKDVSELLYGGL